MGAKKKPQETLSAADLGIEADEAGESGSRTEVYAVGEPPSRGDSQKIEDEGGDAADKIVAYLQEKKLI
jgi:electron transfer flavoprotein beta subunit